LVQVLAPPPSGGGAAFPDDAPLVDGVPEVASPPEEDAPEAPPDADARLPDGEGFPEDDCTPDEGPAPEDTPDEAPAPEDTPDEAPAPEDTPDEDLAPDDEAPDEEPPEVPDAGPPPLPLGPLEHESIRPSADARRKSCRMVVPFPNREAT
jgi:hypothetical protein